MDKKYFTAPEIDILIPQLERIFEHIETCRSRAETLASESITIPPGKTAKDVVQLQLVRSQVEFLMEAVQEDINHIQSLGGVTKDIEAGLVDFLGEVEGQDVWLCWKKGEHHVRYWHPLDSGFTDRRALRPSDIPPTLH